MDTQFLGEIHWFNNFNTFISMPIMKNVDRRIQHLMVVSRIFLKL